jgi:hypothetical protein
LYEVRGLFYDISDSILPHLEWFSSRKKKRTKNNVGEDVKGDQGERTLIHFR